jgi:hypothetical protein
MDPANYSMRLRQQGGMWHVSVTRSIRGGRGSASLYHMTRDSQSETRTGTLARRPASARGAWQALGRAASRRTLAVAQADLRAAMIRACIAPRCEQCGAAPGAGCLPSPDAESGPASLVVLDETTAAHSSRIVAALNPAIAAGRIRRSQVLAYFGKAAPAGLAGPPRGGGLVGWLRRRAARMYDV